MSSFNKYPHVFSPIKIGNMEVKNRIQFSPMVSSLSTPTGGVSPELLGYIKYQAQSGVGVITILTALTFSERLTLRAMTT